jgi:PAS domain S-box-containing protein
MLTQSSTKQTLLAEIVELRARLDEAEETLRAIHSGEIDALVIETSTGTQIFTLQGQDAELNRFRGEILGQISDAVIVVDDDQHVTYLNAAAEQQYGIRASEALGRLVTEIYQYRWLHPSQEAEMRAALNETSHWRGESVHIKRNGEIIQVESSVTRLHPGKGIHSGLLAVVRDITESALAKRALSESKERWKLALKLSNLGAWELNLVNRTSWRSLRYDQIFGYREPLPEWTYDIFIQHVLEEDRAEVDQCFQRAIAEYQDWSFRCRIRRIDGSVRWIWGYAKHLGEAGEPSERLFGLIEDITERKHAKQALKDAARRKDEFLAMLAHELRNPLGPMRNVAQLLKMGSLDADRISWCGDVVDRQVGHLSQLVDDLLDISRITLGKIELKKESLEVSDFVLPAVETTRPLIDARQQQFSLMLPPQPLRVEGDRVRLTQVVTNLLSNAAKYTAQGGHIGLTVEQFKGEVCIRVCDNGCGIASSALPHLFEVFYQVNSDIARSQGGLGIGLSLVQRLVKMHSGDVHAFSAGLGEGSEFVVRLPLLSLPATATAVTTDHLSSSDGELRILIVDDYYAAAESLAMVLQIKGHQVWIAHDGLSAIEMAQVKLPQVVILDIGLPEMDGYEVAKKLRQCTDLGDLLIIALSGYVPPTDPEMLRGSGFDEYLTKPVDIEKLLNILDKWQVHEA